MDGSKAGTSAESGLNPGIHLDRLRGLDLDEHDAHHVQNQAYCPD